MLNLVRGIVVVTFIASGVAWWMANASSVEGAIEAPTTIGARGQRPGRFIKPRAIAVAKDGSFYAVDRSGRIQHLADDGSVLNVWTLPEFKYGQPVGMTVEANGNLLVNDSHYSRILRYDPQGREILARWGSNGLGPGQLTFGRDVVVDAQGMVYAGDFGGLNDRILKFTSSGEFIKSWGKMGGAPGQFQRPQGMAIEVREGTEYLLVADCANHRVQRFSLDGRYVSSLGRLGQGPGEFRYPIAVAVDHKGAILVCEWGNHRIQKFSADEEFLGFWGGPGSAPGRLSTPWDIEVGPDGRVYVADYGNHRVQIFDWETAAVQREPPASDVVAADGVASGPESQGTPQPAETRQASDILSGRGLRR